MKIELVRRASIILLGVTALLLLLTACGGSADKSSPVPTVQQPTATATPVRATPTATPVTVVPPPMPARTPTAAPTPTPTTATSAPTATPTAGSGASVVQVKISEAPYSFVPDTLSFQRGKTYTLQFNVTKEFHTFTVADLNLDIYIDAGKSVTQVVTFNKVGTFTLLCTIHEDQGQVGKVIVS